MGAAEEVMNGSHRGKSKTIPATSREPTGFGSSVAQVQRRDGACILGQASTIPDFPARPVTLVTIYFLND
jgi:hypothetical protein